MNDTTRFDAVHVDANPAATIEDAPARQLELLDKDELVELSIRPSLWFIAIVSARVVVAFGVVAAVVALAARGSGSQMAGYTVSLAVLILVLRVVIAALQWASRVYVLTNRRVMRFSGVLNVDLAECPLKHIGQTDLRHASAERMLRVGSISMTPAGQGPTAIIWEHVARAEQVYERVVRAIQKAQSKP